MKNKGFTLIDLMIVIAIFGIIAAVVIPNLNGCLDILDITGNETAINETAVTNTTIFENLAARSISSLNLTELEFMVDCCASRATSALDRSFATKWANIAIVYQNQIIINELEERP